MTIPFPDADKQNAAEPEDYPLYDFRRAGILPETQIRALTVLFDRYIEALDSSLSAYLSARVKSRRMRVEQIPYADFLNDLPSPTCLFVLNMGVSHVRAIFELSPSLIFPLLEIMLGAKNGGGDIRRKITDVEQNILYEVMEIMVRELGTTWGGSLPFEFRFESAETDPQASTLVGSIELAIVCRVETRIGETTGAMNLAMPSVALKSLGSRSDLDRSSQNGGTLTGYDRIVHLMKRAGVNMDARLDGSTIPVRDFLELKAGQVIALPFPIERPIDCFANGRRMYKGQIVELASKIGFQIDEHAE